MPWDCDNPQCNRARISDTEDSCTKCGRPRSLPPETEVARIMKMAREKRASQPKINVGGQPVNYAKQSWVCETCKTINSGSSLVCKNYRNPKYHPEASKLLAAGRSIAGAGRMAGGAVKSALGVGGGPLRAVVDIATNWSSTISENVRAKTVESIILIIAAVVLVSFGFLWAAIGVLFFMFYLYLPSEEDVMARARKSSSDVPENMLLRLKELIAHKNKLIRSSSIAKDRKDFDSAEALNEEAEKVDKEIAKLEVKIRALGERADEARRAIEGES